MSGSQSGQLITWPSISLASGALAQIDTVQVLAPATGTVTDVAQRDGHDR